MKNKTNKAVALFLCVLVFLSMFVSAAEAESEVDAVIGQLEAIDTLQQMQAKRYTYTAKSHYDTGTTSESIINGHNKARNNYEAYVADMFAKREQARLAYEALSDEQKAQIDPALVEKLSNELPTIFNAKEIAVTPRYDEYCFETVDGGAGYGYEVSNHMISGDIPQTFILVNTSDGKTSWTPDGKYSYGESNYELTYCCDIETPIQYGIDYKRVNLEDSGYFDSDSSDRIRAALQYSYPFVTMDEMKQRLKESGMDAEFVDSITRADMIAAVQMAVWTHANVADSLGYFASVDTTKNTGIYFTPLHDYTNEVWDWLPGKRQRSYDSRAQYRVNRLGEYLCNLQPVEPELEQIVISEIEVVRTELLSAHDDMYDVTVYVTLNGGGDARDNLDITAITYNANDDGTYNVTDARTKKATREKDCYSIDISVKPGDRISVEVEGAQYLAKGAYFYSPEGGRDVSQSLVGISEGYTNVKAEREVIFVAPEYTIEAPGEITITDGEKTKLDVYVVPEIGAPEVEFSSSDESVIKVDEKGNVEAVGSGTATITVTLKDDEPKTVTITVTVEKKEYKIETPDEITVEKGITELIYVKVTPPGELAPTFSSADESIAKVDEFGNVTGVGAGTTTIYIDFGNGEVRTVMVTVPAPAVPSVPSLPKTHHVCFGKTDGIGWYEVSVNGGDFFPQGPNSTLEVQEGSILVVRVQDMWIDDEFDFYVNGSKVPMDPANTITVVVDGYMLIGALSMDVEVPDVDESLNIFQRIIRFFKNIFADIGSWFRSLFG